MSLGVPYVQYWETYEDYRIRTLAEVPEDLYVLPDVTDLVRRVDKKSRTAPGTPDPVQPRDRRSSGRGVDSYY